MSKRDPLVLLEDIMLGKLPVSCRKSSDAFTHKFRGRRCRTQNRIVHDYFGLDLEIIWEIIQHDLSELESQVRALQN